MVAKYKIFVTVDTSYALTLCIDMHMCIYFEKVLVSVRKKQQICLPNKEYLNDQRCQIKNMDAKCKLFVTLLTLDRHVHCV